VEGWPGHEFSIDTDAGKALLGSPVGRWAGYFLMQHKWQLGGNKYISKLRVFKSEKEGNWPYFLFYVEGAAASGSGDMAEADSGMRGTRVVKRSEDGNHVIREHVTRAKL
jgi:hypothetical protein